MMMPICKVGFETTWHTLLSIIGISQPFSATHSNAHCFSAVPLPFCSNYSAAQANIPLQLLSPCNTVVACCKWLSWILTWGTLCYMESVVGDRDNTHSRILMQQQPVLLPSAPLNRRISISQSRQLIGLAKTPANSCASEMSAP